MKIIFKIYIQEDKKMEMQIIASEKYQIIC